MAAPLTLVGDIGGTNARFAIAEISDDLVELHDPLAFVATDFSGADSAMRHYLDQVGAGRPDRAVLAVAGPVERGRAAMTNGVWTLSEGELSDDGLSVRLINDFTALALSIPRLGQADLVSLGPAVDCRPDLTVAVIGAGTGFGAAAVVSDGYTRTPTATEAGHVAFAPTDDAEIEILRLLTRRFGRVSIERILSGSGLAVLRSALGEIEGEPATVFEPSDVLEAASLGADPISMRTVERFAAIYGAVAGDIALTYGARGGVYLGGGIAPRILGTLQQGEFRRRFEAKGRFASYMAAIPTFAIIHPYAALLGAARAGRRAFGSQG